MEGMLYMNILLPLVILAIIILLYLFIKNLNLNSNVQNLIFTFILSVLIVYIILNPKSCIEYTLNGAKLFFNSVFPSLFPFLVLVNLIFAFGGMEIYSKFFGKLLCAPLGLPKECSVVLLASMFCGYPLGARYAGKLYENNIIDKKTLQRLLNIATNGSPLFIIGTVGTAMLHSSFLGYILLISNLISCLVMGLILPGRFKAKQNNSYTNSVVAVTTLESNTPNFGVALKNALEDAVKSCLSIGSFVIIFSVFINIIKSSAIYYTALNQLCNLIPIPNAMINGAFLGLIEITNGCSILSLSTLSTTSKTVICSFLIGFSGLSITAQVYSFVYNYKISMKKYMFFKGIQGIICAIITFLMLNLPFTMIEQETFISNSAVIKPETPLLIILITFLVLPLFISLLRKN